MYPVSTVFSGVGSFPLDMLRYDACFPSKSEDAAVISESMNTVGKWTVRVSKFVGNVQRSRNLEECFTIDRWKSFGAHQQPSETKTRFVEKPSSGW